jgi:hypothetical protein
MNGWVETVFTKNRPCWPDIREYRFRGRNGVISAGFASRITLVRQVS